MRPGSPVSWPQALVRREVMAIYRHNAGLAAAAHVKGQRSCASVSVRGLDGERVRFFGPGERVWVVRW